MLGNWGLKSFILGLQVLSTYHTAVTFGVVADGQDSVFALRPCVSGAALSHHYQSSYPVLLCRVDPVYPCYRV